MNAMLASIGDSLKIWEERGRADELVPKTRFQAGADCSYHSVSWNHTNQVVALGGSEPKVHLVQVNNGQLLSSLVLSESKLSNVQVRAVSFSPNSRHLACALGSPIQLWDMKKRQIKAVFTGHTHHVISLAFNPAGDVYSADWSGKVKLWSSKSSTPLVELSAVEGRRQLTCMALSPISPVLVAGFSDGTLRVWESTGSGAADTLLRTQQSHADRVTAIGCSSRNSRLVATVGSDGKLVLIDTGSKTSHDVCAVCETGEALTSMAFHEDGLHCAVGSAEGSIILYDWRSLRHPVITIPAHSPHPVAALAYQAMRTGREALSSSASVASLDSVPTLLPAPTAAPVQAAASRQSSARPPTADEDVPDPRKNLLSSSSPGGRSRPSTPSSAVRPADISKPLDSKPPTIQPVPHSSPRPRDSLHPLPSTSIRGDKGESLFDGVATAKPSISLAPVPVVPTAPAAPAQNPLPTPPLPLPTQEDDSFASAYAARLRLQSDIGGHPKPILAAQPLPAEVLDDVQFQHSLLHTQVDRLANGRSPGASHLSSVRVGREFEELRHAVQPVTSKELDDALELLRYDIHTEMQDVIKEQVRQFVIAKEETANIVRELSHQLADLLQSNKELREENERLRRIY